MKSHLDIKKFSIPYSDSASPHLQILYLDILIQMEKTRIQIIVNAEMFIIKLVWEETKCRSVGDRLNKIWKSKYLFKKNKTSKNYFKQKTKAR